MKEIEMMLGAPQEVRDEWEAQGRSCRRVWTSTLSPAVLIWLQRQAELRGGDTRGVRSRQMAGFALAHHCLLLDRIPGRWGGKLDLVLQAIEKGAEPAQRVIAGAMMGYAAASTVGRSPEAILAFGITGLAAPLTPQDAYLIGATGSLVAALAELPPQSVSPAWSESPLHVYDEESETEDFARGMGEYDEVMVGMLREQYPCPW